MVEPPLFLDAEKRTLRLSGACLDILSTCRAMCCREWVVGLTADEHQTDLFLDESVCSADGKPCIGKKTSCVNRRYRLQKKTDSSCIYLTAQDTCKIYDRRPQVCREFTCKNGWKLNTIAADPHKPHPAAPDSTGSNPFVPALSDDTCFIRNPLINLKTVFFSGETGELVLVSKLMHKCTASSIKVQLGSRQWSDETIMTFISLFDGTKTISVIEDVLGRSTGGTIDSIATGELARVLLGHQILLPKL